MEIKSLISLQVSRNGRLYVFTLPVGSPFGEAYDCAVEIAEKILEAAQKTLQEKKPQPDIINTDIPIEKEFKGEV